MKKLTIIIFSIGLLIGLSTYVRAESSSIGISPSQISIENLKPGLSTIRQIIISRSVTAEDEAFLIVTDNTEGNDWLGFSPSKSVVIKAGENRTEVIVTITVPAEALYKRYSPNIHIIQQKDAQLTGVSIQSGVVLNFDLLVTDKDVISLKVLSAKVEDIAFGSNIIVVLNIENLGNVASAPSKVKLVISDAKGNEVKTLESTDTATVKALSTESQQVIFKDSNLAIGEYLAKLTVYDASNLEMYNYDLSFRVTEATPTTSLTSEGLNNTYFGIAFIVIGLVLCLLAIFLIAKKNKKKSN
jgi:hypothetical protein